MKHKQLQNVLERVKNRYLSFEVEAFVEMQAISSVFGCRGQASQSL